MPSQPLPSRDWEEPPTSVCRTVPNPQPPGTGARGSSSQSSGVYFPPAPRGKEALMMFWTLIPATSPPPSGGESRLRCFGTRREHFSPPPHRGRSPDIDERRGDLHTSPHPSGGEVFSASIPCQGLCRPNQCAATENATHLCGLHPNRSRHVNGENTGYRTKCVGKKSYIP